MSDKYWIVAFDLVFDFELDGFDIEGRNRLGTAIDLRYRIRSEPFCLIRSISTYPVSITADFRH